MSNTTHTYRDIYSYTETLIKDGKWRYEIGQTALAIMMLNAAIKELRKLKRFNNRTEMLIECYDMLTMIYCNEKMYQEAITMCEQKLRKLRNLFDRRRCRGCIAAIYIKWNCQDKLAVAIEQYRKACYKDFDLDENNSEEEFLFVAGCWNKIGIIQQHLKQISLAVTSFHRAIQIYKNAIKIKFPNDYWDEAERCINEIELKINNPEFIMMLENEPI